MDGWMDGWNECVLGGLVCFLWRVLDIMKRRFNTDAYIYIYIYTTYNELFLGSLSLSLQSFSGECKIYHGTK